MGLFDSRTKKEPRQKNDKTVSYDDAVRTGSSIGKFNNKYLEFAEKPRYNYLKITAGIIQIFF